jgi:hypothetical protein
MLQIQGTQNRQNVSKRAENEKCMQHSLQNRQDNDLDIRVFERREIIITEMRFVFVSLYAFGPN